MKICSFVFSRSRQRDRLEALHFLSPTSLKRVFELVGHTVMVAVCLNNLNRGLGWLCIFGPIDGVKEDSAFLRYVRSGPEFGFAGGVVCVPRKKPHTMIMERLGI